LAACKLQVTGQTDLPRVSHLCLLASLKSGIRIQLFEREEGEGEREVERERNENVCGKFE